MTLVALDEDFDSSNNIYYKETSSLLKGPLHFDDERVIEILRNKYLDLPSTKPYNFSSNKKYMQTKNSYSWPFINTYLKYIFKNQTGGFFIEAGALDGEFLSNTLYLEKELGWTGLLIESDPYNYKELLQKNRHAWTSHSCLSSEPYPKETVMVSLRRNVDSKTNSWTVRGSSYQYGIEIIDNSSKPIYDQPTTSYASVQCFPFFSYLLALNRTEIDLIVLDLQGIELHVLRTIPFDKVSIRVFVVEYYAAMRTTINNNLDNFFTEKGYVLLACGGEPDYIYIKKHDSFLNEIVYQKPKICRGNKISIIFKKLNKNLTYIDK